MRVVGLIAIVAFTGVAVRADDELPDHAIARVGPKDTDGHEIERVRLVAISPDGRRLATTGEPGDPKQDRVVRVWNVATGELEHTLVARDEMITVLAFSPNGSRLVASTADHPAGTQVWETRTGNPLAVVTGGNGHGRVRDDGRLIVVDRFESTDVLLVIDPDTGREIHRFPVAPSQRFEVTPDGRRLVALRRRGGDLFVTEVETNEEFCKLTGFEGDPRAIAISPDGYTVATAVGTEVQLWELLPPSLRPVVNQNPQRIAEIEPLHRLAGEKPVLRVAFTPDGRRLVTASADNTARIWEVATGGELHAFTGHESLVTALDISADGERIATGSFDRTAIVWNATGTRRSSLPAEPPTVEEANELWAQLGSDDAMNAGKAIGLVTRHPTEAVATIRARVHGTLVPAENERIRELVVELDDPDYRVRHRAMLELRKMRGIAKPILLKTYETSLSEEVRDRIRRIVGNDRNVPRFTRTDRLRMYRIVHAAESVAREDGPATADARAVLKEVVDEFPDDDVVHAAKRALERLE